MYAKSNVKEPFIMKKLNNDPKALNLLRALDEFASTEGISIEDGQGEEAFIEKVRAALNARQKDPITIHGFRAQAMFAYVAAALGECTLIAEVDSGLFLADDSNIRRPDFHIITKSGDSFFVEVKNFSPSAKFASFKVTNSYLTRLQKYADRFSKKIKIAIYWRHLRMWTLVGAEYFDKEGEKRILTMESAFKRNEMSILGDYMVGVVPPLTFRCYTNPEKPRRVAPNGTFEVSIQRIAICTSGQEISDPFERKIALFLMLHGRWADVSRPIKIQGDEVIWFDIQAAPLDMDEMEQEFTNIGWLSEMISAQFHELTVRDGKIHRLTPRTQPSDLGIAIPAGYKGNVLRLWRFYLQPNYDDFDGIAPSPKKIPGFT